MKALIPFRRTTDLPSLFRHEVDDLFDRFFGPGFIPGKEINGLPQVWAPSVDVLEMEKEIVIKADLPGVIPNEVEIYAQNGALVLKGLKKEEKEEKIANYFRTERFVGTFYREIPLPVGVDPEKITATTINGVLTVIIPKTPAALPKKVSVKAMV
jgi:HSP20 family protein